MVIVCTLAIAFKWWTADLGDSGLVFIICGIFLFHWHAGDVHVELKVDGDDWKTEFCYVQNSKPFEIFKPLPSASISTFCDVY